MHQSAVPTAAVFFQALLLSLSLHHAAQAQDAAASTPAEAPQSAKEPDPVAEAERALSARIVDMRTRNSRMGPAGGLHVVDAGSGPAASFRISLLGELMKKDDFLLPGDDNRYGGGTLSLGVSPTDWLELSGAMQVRSLNNTGNATSPGLLQSIGDVFVDVKGFHEVRPGVTLGGDVGVWFLAGQGEVGRDFSATSAQLRFNTSLDLRDMTPKRMPMRMRFNVGYKFDNSARTVEGIEDQRLAAIEERRPVGDVEFQHLVTRVERFALNVNRVDTLPLAAGAEWPLDTDRAVVSPLVEYTWGLPINRQGFTCPFATDDNGNKLPGVDSCLDQEGVDTWPSTFTGGIAIAPKRLEGLSMVAAVDVGVTGMKNFVHELAPNAPYMIYVGAGYAVDVRPRVVVEEVEIEKEVVVAVEPPTGRVRGQVVEQGAGTPVPDARVHFSGTDRSDLWADDQGRFVSYAFAPSTEVAIELEAEGYNPGSCAATIPEDASDVELTCELVALPRVGSVRGLVTDAKGAPVPGVNVVLKGPVTRVVTTSDSGHFMGHELPPGDYTARIDHEGHLIKIAPVHVEVREQVEPRIALTAKPKRAKVLVRRDRIVLRGNLSFVNGTAQLEPSSEPLLEELADLMIRSPEILRIEVQGHLDDAGDAQERSQQQAEAVRAWLLDHGVEADRVLAKGYGAQRALVPNITARNRARNRRVELHILDSVKPSADGN